MSSSSSSSNKAATATMSKERMEEMRAKWRNPFASEKKRESPRAKRSTSRQCFFPDPTATSAALSSHMVPNNGKRMPIPSKEFTKVDPSVTELCANLSQQIYGASSATDFRLSASPQSASSHSEPTMILFDNHGDLNPSIPAFAVAALDDTIVLAWRGTHQLLDVVTDLGVAPVVATELGRHNVSGRLRTQGMFRALVGSDLQIHEKTIVKYIKTHQITRLVCTGHSLGGGLASVGHLFVQAQIEGDNERSVWHGLSRLTCYTVAFAAPMALVHLPPETTTTQASGEMTTDDIASGDQLLQTVSRNTCNFVFGPDVVPRGYAHTDYIYDSLEAVATEVARENNPLPLNVGSRFVSDALLGIVRAAAQESIPVAIQYRHYGRLLYYAATEQTVPTVLTDIGPQPSSNKNHLSHYTYDTYKIGKEEHTEALMEAHLLFPLVFASYIVNEE